MPVFRRPSQRVPVHPGEVLLEEFLKPYGLTQKELAERLKVSCPRINDLVHGRRGVTPDTALRLARYFGTSPEFWLNPQLAYDLYQAQAKNDYSDIEPFRAPSA